MALDVLSGKISEADGLADAARRQAARAILALPAKRELSIEPTEVVQVDSETSPAVQLADVIIGAAIEAGNTLIGQRSGGLDSQALLSMFADNQFIHLLPDLDFKEQKEFRKGRRGRS